MIKKKYTFLLIALCLLFSSSCMEDFNDRYFIEDYYVEFEEATTKNVAVGEDYVISDQVLSADNQQVSIQLNLLGPTSSVEQKVAFKVSSEQTTAVSGQDYQIDDTEVIIPGGKHSATIELKNSSSGYGESILVLELVGNDLIKPSANYKKIGIRCRY